MELVDSHGPLLPLNHSLRQMTTRTHRFLASKSPQTVQPLQSLTITNVDELQRSLYVALGLSLSEKNNPCESIIFHLAAGMHGVAGSLVVKALDSNRKEGCEFETHQ